MGKALVMSGGGPVGAGWETGLMAGFQEAGLTFTDADLILGTSAGSSVGVLVAAGHDLVAQAERYRRAGVRHAEGGQTRVMQPDPDRADDSQRPTDLFPRGWVAGRNDQAMKAEVAEVSLRAPWALSEEAVIHTFRHVAHDPWPRNFICTCFDCDSLEFVAMDASYGCALDVGVAASCAIPGIYSPVTIGGHRLVDGGVFSPTHLDLAVGHERILFVNMVAVPDREIAAIEASGADMVRIEPDAASSEAMGGQLSEVARTFPACAAGLEQGRRVAKEVAEFWQS